MSYFSSPWHRFFFFIGHTDDEFCPPAPCLMTLEEILHHHLGELGYRRRIFFDGRRKIYSRTTMTVSAKKPWKPLWPLWKTTGSASA